MEYTLRTPEIKWSAERLYKSGGASWNLNSGLMTGSTTVSVLSHSVVSLCDPMDRSPPGSSVRGILQVRILEWVAISYSRGSSPPRDWTRICYLCIGRRVWLLGLWLVPLLLTNNFVIPLEMDRCCHQHLTVELFAFYRQDIGSKTWLHIGITWGVLKTIIVLVPHL